MSLAGSLLANSWWLATRTSSAPTTRRVTPVATGLCRGAQRQAQHRSPQSHICSTAEIQRPGSWWLRRRRNMSQFSAENLRSRTCVGACSSETPKLTEEEIAARLTGITGWVVNDDKTALERSFVAKNWGQAIKFINGASEIAEAEGHHPDIHLTNYRNVKVVVSTHAIGGIADVDFTLCAKLDTIEIEYSPKWLKQQAAATAEQEQ
mmetsp:Transcript_372/g.1240  ORF Transcript_372/g.1240 Transcript_372/m.1240 type:complete len:207 (+) Transcript_372:110-730(+)